MNGVFDTNILVDFLNGVGEAPLEFERYESRYISIMTWIEVLVGCRDAAEQAAARALMSETFELIELPPPVAERAVEIRRERRMRLPDAVVYATALYLECVLVTRDTKDFPESDPTVRVPYRL